MNQKKSPKTAPQAAAAGRKEKRKSPVPTVLLILMLLAGVGIMSYPSVSNWYNGLHQSRAIADYNQSVDQSDRERKQQLWKEAKAYNRKLAQTGMDLSLGEKDDTDPEKEAYRKTLDVSGSGIMGYISIPSVNIRLPIYHDTKESVLQIAVGHLAGTSLPVGGKNTHSVLTGHTGLPSAKLFTDIDQLKKGDTFQLIVLDHTLTYEVGDIRTVLPSEVSSLQIEPGKDLVTLVTCTPYGINTHRLLVTGHRIPTPETDEVPSSGWRGERLWVLLREILPAVLSAAAVCAAVILLKRRRKKRNTRGSRNPDSGKKKEEMK